jgi:hypothetical protein
VSQSWNKVARELANNLTRSSEEISKIAPQGAKEAPTDRLSVHKVVSALEQFQECVRYLNTRRSSGAVIDIRGEDDLQDVLYLMLRPWIPDLTPENPTDRIASRYSIKDFLSKENGIVVEAKYVRDKKHGKDITRELNDDIENYRSHTNCDFLIFFIYDPNSLIPDVTALRKHVESKRNYDGKTLSVHCVVKP